MQPIRQCFWHLILTHVWCQAVGHTTLPAVHHHICFKCSPAASYSPFPLAQQRTFCCTQQTSVYQTCVRQQLWATKMCKIVYGIAHIPQFSSNVAYAPTLLPGQLEPSAIQAGQISRHIPSQGGVRFIPLPEVSLLIHEKLINAVLYGAYQASALVQLIKHASYQP